MDYKGGDNSEEKASKQERGDEKRADSAAAALVEGGGLIAEAKVTSGRELINAVCEYYFDNQSLQDELEAWAISKASAFNPFDKEYTLEQTSLFEEFKILFESRLENFLGSIGVSVDSLYDEIRRDTSTDFYSGNTLVAVVNSSVDFKCFHAMMCDAKAGEFIWGMPPLQDAKTGEMFC